MAASTEKRSILINAGSNALRFASAALVGFFVRPVMVHGLGDERYGIWLLVDSVIAYMALGDLGIGAAVLRYVARFDGLEDREGINRVFSTSFAFFTCIGLLVLAIAFVLAFGWSRPLGVDPRLARDTRWLLALFGVNIAAGFPLGLYARVLEGTRRYPTLNAIQIATLLIRNALFVTIIFAGKGLIAIAIALTVCMLVQKIPLAVFAHRCVPTLRLSARYVDVATFRTIWGYSAYVFTALTAWRFAEQCNPIIINWFLGPAAITYFGIAASLNSNAGDALRRMMQVVTPTVSKWEAVRDFGAIRRLFLVGTRYLLYLAMPLQLGLILFGQPFLSLWMGERYGHLCYKTLVILALPLPLILAYSLAGRILQGSGKVRGLAALAVIRTVMNVPLVILMIRPWGIEGAATATSITITLHSLAVSVLVSRFTVTPLVRLFAQAYVTPVLVSLVLILAWVLGSHFLPPTSWTALFCVGLAGLSLYGAAALAADRDLRDDTTALVRNAHRLMIGSRLAARLAGPRSKGENL